MQVTLVPTHQIVREAEEVVANVLAHVNRGLKPVERRKGGYLAVFRAGARPDEPPILVVCVGNRFPEDKAGKYFRLAIEKGQRLLRNRGHISSRQSRDPKLHQFAGAILCKPVILSFSGLPEEADEAAVLFLGRRLNPDFGAQAAAIAALSQNATFFALT